MAETEAMKTKKTISETLADLRKLFKGYDIEDYEPIPGDTDLSYGVRYLQRGQWVTISSYSQGTKAKNLRQCYQVIKYLFIWAGRGVGGISQGVTFIQGGLVAMGNQQPEDTLAEAYTTLGVEPSATIEEIQGVYHTKIRFAHPDKEKDTEGKRLKEERTKRLNNAFELIEKQRKGVTAR